MRSSEFQATLKKCRRMFEALEEYDRTHQLPTDRVRISLTLSRRTIRKLEELRERTGKPISRLIDELVAAAGTPEHARIPKDSA